MRTNIRFGVSVAALILSDVVDEHPDSDKISRKVSRLINQYNGRADFLERTNRIDFPNFKDLSSVIVLYDLLVRDYLNRCDEIFCHEKDKTVKSFTKNVIKARHKSWLDFYLPKNKKRKSVK